MRTVQLFVSSPGDVELERARVERVTERLNGEFWPRVHFQTVRWETKFYSAHKSFQEHIADAATCDVVIGTFWSRLGTELPAHVSDKYRMADGRPYPSGSAYEVLTAIEARKSADRPDVYVFRKTLPAMVALNDPVARAEADRQWERLEDFFARWFRAPDGHVPRGLSRVQDHRPIRGCGREAAASLARREGACRPRDHLAGRNKRLAVPRPRAV